MARTGAVLNDQLYSNRPSVESGLQRTLRSLVLNSGSPHKRTGTSAAQWEMDTGVSVEGSGTSWSIGLVLMSRPKPRKRYCVSNPRMPGHSPTPLFTIQVREKAGSDRHSPATVLGSQHLAVGGDTHLDRRLGWPSMEGLMVDGVAGALLTLSRQSGKSGCSNRWTTSSALAGIQDECV
jgi:hypothetical protein